MPGPISRRPAGLLDLLLAQQQGKNPSSLSDAVAPVIDLSLFYEQERVDLESKVLSASAVGQAATITVPQGESWKIVGLTVRGTFNIIGSKIRLGLFFGIGTSAFAVVKELTSTAVAATDKFGDGIMPPGLILRPGSQLGCIVHEINLNAGANISTTAEVLYVRMES